MGLIRWLKGKDINEGLAQYQNTGGAILIDVREKDEYCGGHIPGSKNVPLSNLEVIEAVAPDKATPLFLYCLSGARSSQAAAQLKRMGYCEVSNIGGINGYNGNLER